MKSRARVENVGQTFDANAVSDLLKHTCILIIYTLLLVAVKRFYYVTAMVGNEDSILIPIMILENIALK